jgi:P-type Ca2+ transporter type 2C
MEESPDQGLTDAEAASRLSKDGPNIIEKPKRRHAAALVLSTLKEPMFLFMLAAAVLYLVIGDLREGLFMVGAASISIGLVVFQDWRGERALAALRSLATPRCLVVRSGRQMDIAAAQLVVGDLMVTTEGQRIAADAVLIGKHPVRVDESVLTGESAPVLKVASDGEANEQSSLFAGTLALDSLGLARVTATGGATRFGSVGAALHGREEATPLQKSMRQVTLFFAAAAAVTCLCVVLALGLLRGDWVNGGLSGLTVAIGLVPEEFPMVLAVFTVMGSWRLAQHNVLVRRAVAVETLGAISLLCVDKTGTLTENAMKVAQLWCLSDQGEKALLTWAFLATPSGSVDPMDKAIATAAHHQNVLQSVPDMRLISLSPLTAKRLAIVQLWQDANGHHLCATKGAPETIFGMCHLAGTELAKAEAALSALATSGLRVLGVAYRNGDVGPYQLAGLVGFIDPLRADVPEALKQAQAAGVFVVMITGDNAQTARAIAHQAGLDGNIEPVLGTQIETTDGADLARLINGRSVFARVSPVQKLKLVSAFRAMGHVIAMTGDGINDAPALQSAHIGIAMGKRGTDVAREAADIVLLDDSFSSIVGGIRLGRRIYANIRRALVYVIAVHVPIAGLALLPLLLGLPPALLPMHIVILELMIDPIASILFEALPSEQGTMTKRPRAMGQRILGGVQIAKSVLQGTVLLAACLLIFLQVPGLGWSVEQARGGTFVCLVIGNVLLALWDSLRRMSDMKLFNRQVAVAVVMATLAILFGTLYVPPIADLFQIVAPPIIWLPVIFVLALLPALSGYLLDFILSRKAVTN